MTTELNVGDEISVHGYIFVLVEVAVHHDGPPTIHFKSPGELMLIQIKETEKNADI